MADLTRFVYSETVAPEAVYPLAPPAPPSAETHELTYREAMREAMTAAMHRDPRVFLLGADVGAYGGCFAVSKGMVQEFGPQRSSARPSPNRG